VKRIGLCYHPLVTGARELADRLRAVCGELGVEGWVAPLDRDEVDVRLGEQIPGADLLVCVGGDGTVLHASELVAEAGVPLLGVRMGRLGFLTETTEEAAEAVLRRALAGEGRIEHHAMVQARVDEDEPVHALNDVVIGRHTLGRTISVGVRLDGVLLAEYRADAVIVASATGSTGYALSVGGPILHPTSADFVLIPVAPHLSHANALVLPGGLDVSLEVERGDEAVMTVDGSQEWPVRSGSIVRVSRSSRSVQFLRLAPENQFYANLAQRLGWLRVDHVLDQGGDGPRQA
jgi:NAD+ kinase